MSMTPAAATKRTPSSREVVPDTKVGESVIATATFWRPYSFSRRVDGPIHIREWQDIDDAFDLVLGRATLQCVTLTSTSLTPSAR